MPIDPRSYFINVPQSQGPMDMYRDYMSLRDLMDRRRYNDLLMRKYQMQEEKDAREEAERQAFRNVLSAANPTDQDLIKASPELAWKYITSRATGQKEQRAAEKAATEAVESDTERRRKLNQQMADIGMEAVKIKDPVQREEFFNTQLAGTLIDRGFTPAQEFGGFPVPKDERAAQFAYGSAYGADKLREFLDKQAKAEQERTMNPLQIAEQRAKTAHAQQVLTGQALPTKPALPALFEQWLPGYLESNQMTDTSQNRSQAVEAYHKLLGISQGMSPEAVQQRLDLFTREAALKAEAEKNKPQSAEASKVTSVAETLVPELTQLKKAIADGGKAAILSILTGSNPELRKLATNAADKVGRLRSGGAVNPAEEARFMGAIASMYDLAPWVEGTMPSQNAIDRYITEADVVLRGIKPGASRTPPAGGNQPVQKWGRDKNGNPVRIP